MTADDVVMSGGGVVRERRVREEKRGEERRGEERSGNILFKYVKCSYDVNILVQVNRIGVNFHIFHAVPSFTQMYVHTFVSTLRAYLMTGHWGHTLRAGI